jgi:hypothetical protein
LLRGHERCIKKHLLDVSLPLVSRDSLWWAMIVMQDTRRQIALIFPDSFVERSRWCQRCFADVYPAVPDQTPTFQPKPNISWLNESWTVVCNSKSQVHLHCSCAVPRYSRRTVCPSQQCNVSLSRQWNNLGLNRYGCVRYNACSFNFHHLHYLRHSPVIRRSTFFTCISHPR